MSTVRRRHVFYFSGFDPRGPAHCHRIYKEEAAKQARLLGATVTVAQRTAKTKISSSWEVHLENATQATHTTFEYLRYDDIVRRHWTIGLGNLYRSAFSFYGYSVVSGWTLAILGASRQFFSSWTTPALVLFGLPALPVLAGLVVALAQQDHASAVISFAAGMLAIFPAVLLAKKVQAAVNSDWLLRIGAFTAKVGRDEVPELEARLDDLAAHAADYLRSSTDDEVLFIGHSLGPVFAVSVLARVMAADKQLFARSPGVAFLSLGGLVPFLGLHPQAARFRAEIVALATNPDLTWVDFTAPQDPLCFPLRNPVSLSRVPAAALRANHPICLSGQFTGLIDPATYGRLKFDFFRMHSQYVLAGDRLGRYDYLSITAGAVPLKLRYPQGEYQT